MISERPDLKRRKQNPFSISKIEHALEKFKANAYKQAMKFDIEVILPKYEKLYEKCIEDYLSK